MENSNPLIQLDPNDNVFIARRDLQSGEILSVAGLDIEVKQKVKLGFKIAAQKIEKGDKILKYGIPIGSATCDIKIGEIVHVHNIKSDYVPTYTIKENEE